MIRHTVAFRLHHKKDSQEEQRFLTEAKKLATIPNVLKFECLREIGKKNNFDFGLSMEFKNSDDYDAYNSHPNHLHFVENIWIPSVEEFIEIDYQID